MAYAPLGTKARREQEFFADWTVHPAGDRLRWRRELRHVLEAAGGRGLGRVLSLGCGRGRFERMLAERAERVLGIDLSPESVEVAREEAGERGLGNLRFECADVTSFDLGERFDTVVCIGFLHHLDEEEGRRLLGRAHAHLEPGGLLHTQDPNVHGVLRALGRRVLGDRYHAYHSPDERELDPEAVRRDALEAGFASARLRYMDLTLIPGMQLLPRAPAPLMHAFEWVDRAWCALPAARWASGFSLDARR